MKDETCSVAGCDRFGTVARGYCGKHYQRWRNHGTPTPAGVVERDRTEGPCSVDECPRDKVCGGYCGLHYQRFMKHGDPRQTPYLDVTCDPERRCRYCGKDISHKQVNASWCNRDCKYWARIWKHRKGVASNPESIRVPPPAIKKILSAGQCSYCGEAGPVELDHIIPLSRGGAHREGNLTPACRPCNRSKWNMLLVEWRKSALSEGG